MEMGDIIDLILSKLKPSTRQILERMAGSEDGCAKSFCQKLEGLQDKARIIQVNQVIRSMDEETAVLNSKTAELKLEALKYQQELERLENNPHVKEEDQHTAHSEQYTEKINALEVQMQNMLKDVGDSKPGDLDPVGLFTEVNELFQQVQSNIEEIEKLDKKLEFYEGLPPNIEEATAVVSALEKEIEEKKKKMEMI